MASSILKQCVVMVSMITMVSAGSAAADGQSPPDVETRVFDIRSLLLEVPDYRAIFSDLRSDDLYGPPARPGEPGPVFRESAGIEPAQPPKDTRLENAEIILEMIQEVVDPDSWLDRGGDLGSIRFFAGQLIVSQTAQNLARIERLLDLLEAVRSTTVRLEAYWVLIPSDTEERRALGDLISKKEFTDDEFRGLLEEGEDNLSVTRASLSGFDGQRVYTSSGQQINIVVGVTAVVAGAASEVQPTVRQLMSGVTLESQPVIDRQRNTVLLDLRASIAEVEPKDGPATVPDSSLAAGVSAPPYRVAHFATSLSVPMDKVSLVSAAPYDPLRDVLLFVRATVK